MNRDKVNKDKSKIQHNLSKKNSDNYDIIENNLKILNEFYKRNNRSSGLTGFEGTQKSDEVANAFASLFERLGVPKLLQKLGTVRDEKPKETIKVEVLNKDAGSRRDYKLTSQTKFKHFMNYLSSELRSNDLLYVIDAKAGKNLTLDEETREKHKHKVRDILINRR